MTDTEYLRNVIKGYVQSSPVYINYLSKKDNNLVLSANGVTNESKYLDGSCVLTKQYTITSTKPYSINVTEQQQIYTFLNGLENHLRKNFKNYAWDNDHQAREITIVNSGNITQRDSNLAKWVMSFKLEYFER